MATLDRQDFASPASPTWCKGCGNYGILNGIKMALAAQNIPPHQIIIVTGIGCGSKLPHYMKVNGFHGLHGRPLPVATGIRLANHGIKVMTVLCTRRPGRLPVLSTQLTNLCQEPGSAAGRSSFSPCK